jgi:hypothetical protein
MKTMSLTWFSVLGRGWLNFNLGQACCPHHPVCHQLAETNNKAAKLQRQEAASVACSHTCLFVGLFVCAQMPSAGAKPSPAEQLPPGRATLITGCQAHETSADACPGGATRPSTRSTYSRSR